MIANADSTTVYMNGMEIVLGMSALARFGTERMRAMLAATELCKGSARAYFT